METFSCRLNCIFSKFLGEKIGRILWMSLGTPFYIECKLSGILDPNMRILCIEKYFTHLFDFLLFNKSIYQLLAVSSEIKINISLISIKWWRFFEFSEKIRSMAMIVVCATSMLTILSFAFPLNAENNRIPHSTTKVPCWLHVSISNHQSEKKKPYKTSP